MTEFKFLDELTLKGIVHFEIKIWYLLAYPKGIQDVGVFFFFSSVDPILIFLGQTVLVYQSVLMYSRYQLALRNPLWCAIYQRKKKYLMFFCLKLDNITISINIFIIIIFLPQGNIAPQQTNLNI